MTPVRVPWEFSSAPASDETAVPNLPTAEGQTLGVELARLADAEESVQRERFPNMKSRCHDCAFRAGTTPNGCVETLMDVVKALAEAKPFYCHHGLSDGEPTRLCGGYALLVAKLGER